MFNYLSGDEALYGVGEHDDTGEEEPSGIGNWVDLAVVIEEITCKEMKEPRNKHMHAHRCTYMYNILNWCTPFIYN